MFKSGFYCMQFKQYAFKKESKEKEDFKMPKRDYIQYLVINYNGK